MKLPTAAGTTMDDDDVASQGENDEDGKTAAVKPIVSP